MKYNFKPVLTILLLFLFYTTGFAKRDTTYTYYDQFWFKCNKREAVFFGKTTESKPGNFLLKIYDHADLIQFSGNFKDKDLKFPTGLMRYYNKEGKVSKTLQFTPISTLTKVITYYPNGKPFIVNTYSPNEKPLGTQVLDENGEEIENQRSKIDSTSAESMKLSSGMPLYFSLKYDENDKLKFHQFLIPVEKEANMFKAMIIGSLDRFVPNKVYGNKGDFESIHVGYLSSSHTRSVKSVSIKK